MSLLQSLQSITNRETLLSYLQKLEPSRTKLDHYQKKGDPTDRISFKKILQKFNEVNAKDPNASNAFKELLKKLESNEKNKKTQASTATFLTATGASQKPSDVMVSAISSAVINPKSTNTSSLKDQLAEISSISELKEFLSKLEPKNFTNPKPGSAMARHPYFCEKGNETNTLDSMEVAMKLIALGESKNYTLDSTGQVVTIVAAKLSKVSSIDELITFISTLEARDPSGSTVTLSGRSVANYCENGNETNSFRYYSVSMKIAELGASDNYELDYGTGQIVKKAAPIKPETIKQPNLKEQLEKISTIDELITFVSTLKFQPSSPVCMVAYYYAPGNWRSHLNIMQVQKKIVDLKQAENFDFNEDTGEIIKKAAQTAAADGSSK